MNKEDIKINFDKIKPMLIAAAPYVLIGGIALYVGNKLLKATKKLSDVFGGSENKEELNKNIDTEQKKLINEGQKLSYTIFSYKSLAGMLLNAMGGVGTEEEIIYAVFTKMNNDLDLTELYKQFSTHLYIVGVRPLYLDLGQWINQELNSKEIAKLNKILADKNITYKF